MREFGVGKSSADKIMWSLVVESEKLTGVALGCFQYKQDVNPGVPHFIEKFKTL